MCSPNYPALDIGVLGPLGHAVWAVPGLRRSVDQVDVS
jgi:hypothetical protein